MMLSFDQYQALQEAIRIVKRASSDDIERLTKKGEEPTGKIASVGGYDIILTKHINDVRSGEEGGRGQGILTKTYKTVVDKLLKLRKSISDGYYHLIYKVNQKYNDMVVSIKGKEIRVVTVMQHKRQTPNSYHVKPGDKRIVIEGTEIETIDLGEIVIN